MKEWIKYSIFEHPIYDLHKNDHAQMINQVYTNLPFQPLRNKLCTESNSFILNDKQCAFQFWQNQNASCLNSLFSGKYKNGKKSRNSFSFSWWRSCTTSRTLNMGVKLKSKLDNWKNEDWHSSFLQRIIEHSQRIQLRILSIWWNIAPN